jgi:carboxymethylenebutenolidase
MCFDLQAEPPIQPLVGSLAQGEDLVLTSHDGTRFAAYGAHSGMQEKGGPAIVVLPDVRGLYHFYKELALRFAEAGVEAVAIDYFGRTAGLTARDDQFEYMPHVMQTQAETVAEDVAAAVAWLRRPDGSQPSAIFTVGFCFGGRNSFMQATKKHGLAGVIGFYGSPGGGRGPGPTVTDLAGEFECPVLGLFGGTDEGIPQSAIDAFAIALDQAGVENEMIVYPNAPHSFFDKHQEQYADQSADAWERIQAFIKDHTPSQ